MLEPDPDGDLSPGLTVVQGAGGSLDSTVSPRKYAEFSVAATAPIVLAGPVSLDLWSTAAGFDPRRDAHPWLHLQDCAADDTGCTVLASADTHYRDWNGGYPGWVRHTLSLGSVNHTVPAGRLLRLRVMSQHTTLWLAMSGTRPSRLDFSVRWVRRMGGPRPSVLAARSRLVLTGDAPGGGGQSAGETGEQEGVDR